MRKRWMILMMVLIVPGLFLTTSCSKKPVVDEAALTTRKADGLSQAQLDEQRLAAQRAAEQQRQLMAARERFLNEHIYFDFDSSVLTAAAQATLRNKAEWLYANPNANVVIEGHCDERGTTAYNLALGERRAASAKAFLVNLGISGARLTTISYGEEMPLDPGHNESAWAKNRRTAFVLE